MKQTEMLRNVDFDTIVQEADQIQSECADYDVIDANSKNCYYTHGNQLSFIPSHGPAEILGITPFALSQLCAKLGVPSPYIQKCIEEGMSDLAADNINYWLEDYHKDLFVRAHGPNVRGVLSSRYATLDAPEILDVASGTFDEFNVKGAFISPERLHLRMVEKAPLDVPKEDLFAGLTIDSSDVGRSTLSVRLFIYKQICTNGLCISDNLGVVYSQRHVGLTKDEFYNELAAGMKEVQVKVRVVAEAIAVLVGYAQRAGKTERAYVDYRAFDESQQAMFKKKMMTITRLSEKGFDETIDLMYNEYTVSRWGFINALTQIAQQYTLERRLDVERTAGTLLMNSRAVF